MADKTINEKIGSPFKKPGDKEEGFLGAVRRKLFGKPEAAPSAAPSPKPEDEKKKY